MFTVPQCLAHRVFVLFGCVEVAVFMSSNARDPSGDGQTFLTECKSRFCLSFFISMKLLLMGTDNECTLSRWEAIMFVCLRITEAYPYCVIFQSDKYEFNGTV